MFDKNILFKIIKNQKLKFIQIVKLMNIPIKQNRIFSQFLFNFIKKGELFQTNEKEFFIPKFLGEVKGKLKIKNGKNFAFLDIDKDNSIFILSWNINGAFDNDMVEAKYFESPNNKKHYQGIVTKIIKRNKIFFVGRIKKFKENFGLIPYDKRIKGKFLFDNEKNLKVNMQVKVKIISFSKNFYKVKLVKEIGMFNEPFMDILSAIEDFEVITSFSEKTINESNLIPKNLNKENKQNRKDLRNRLIYTIDGDDTKDFDDAIEVTKLNNGNYNLSVHIADVSYYVKENSAIDQEAKDRSTSIYFPNMVIPMLPENLSNGICSLNPNVDRFTITCEMEIDSNGKTIFSKIYQSIINSKYKLSYKEVNNFKINPNEFQKNSDQFLNEKLKESLKNALDLSKIIKNFKSKEGNIEFEIEESIIIVDKNGKTKDIIKKERSYSENMIENFMVRTNETIAEFISKRKLPFIYRIHEKPSFEKINDLQKVLKLLNIKEKFLPNPTSKQFSESFNKIKKTNYANFLEIIMLRTMSKAEYSMENIGHFGLASKFYTHFTSPIRRYPDLIVHRMIREYIFNKKPHLSSHFTKILPLISDFSSKREQKALEIERKILDIKKAEFYEKFIGQKKKGQVVSVHKFGLFLEFNNKVNGLIHVSSILDGEYKLDETNFVLTNGKREFKIGDNLEVFIHSVNKIESKINLVLSEFFEKFKEQKNNILKR